MSRRERLLFVGIAVLGAFIITRGLVAAPNFTDAYYHLNAANRLVSGQGLTDPYLWTYIGAPERLPAPSHLYWMPFTSLSAALGMWLLNAPGDYAAAQWPLTLMFAATVYAGFWLGERLGGTRRHAWTAGLLTLFSGYFTRFWGAIDTFAPYAAVGSWCLVWLSLALTAFEETAERKRRRIYVYGALAGAFAGLAHLTRADGILLLLIGWAAVLWPFYRDAQERTQYIASIRQRLIAGVVMSLAYLVVMSPWFLRNLNAIGSPLPLGGTQAIWFTQYNDLFNYPPTSTSTTFFANGLGNLWRTRWEALFGGGLLSGNVGTFIAVEGLIVVTPLMLVGLWQRRREPFLRGFWLYALGVHLAMTLVFPYPGYRGGLFHSAAALVPWWAALGVVGLDAAVDWVVRRRRHWSARTAKWLFSGALVLMAVFVSFTTAGGKWAVSGAMPSLYEELQQTVPAGARVMINDPAQLYYYTGLGGTVLPNAAPEVLPEIARKYGVKYLLLEDVTEDGRALAAPPPLWSILRDPPGFLTPIPFNQPGVRLYAIRAE